MTNHQTDAQRQMIAQCKAESCLDRNVPLGMPPASRPEVGPTVAEYFRRKNATQGPGKYYGLHLVAPLPWRQ